MGNAGERRSAAGGEGPLGDDAFPPVAPTFVGNGAVVTDADKARGVKVGNPGKSDAALAPFALKLGHGAGLEAVAGGARTDVLGAGCGGGGATVAGAAGAGAVDTIGVGSAFATEGAITAGVFSPPTGPATPAFCNPPAGVATPQVAAAATTGGTCVAPADDKSMVEVGALRRRLLLLFVFVRVEDSPAVLASMPWRTLARFSEADRVEWHGGGMVATDSAAGTGAGASVVDDPPGASEAAATAGVFSPPTGPVTAAVVMAAGATPEMS